MRLFNSRLLSCMVGDAIGSLPRTSSGSIAETTVSAPIVFLLLLWQLQLLQKGDRH